MPGTSKVPALSFQRTPVPTEGVIAIATPIAPLSTASVQRPPVTTATALPPITRTELNMMSTPPATPARCQQTANTAQEA